MPEKTVATMIEEIRKLNIEKGWRTGGNTAGDYGALLHSEISEMLEAYRDHRLDSYTTDAGKPDDVGSEAADTAIRLLDMCDVYKITLIGASAASGALPLSKIDRCYVPSNVKSFGDSVNWLHQQAAFIDLRDKPEAAFMTGRFLRSLLAVCDRLDINLPAEYERKMAYNRQRPYQHGGRTLSDVGRVTTGKA